MIVVPPRKLVGVITTLFVPLVDVLIKIFNCPSEPSANEIAPVAAVAFISVTAVVTFATCDEASAVIACEVCAKPNHEGILLKSALGCVKRVRS